MVRASSLEILKSRERHFDAFAFHSASTSPSRSDCLLKVGIDGLWPHCANCSVLGLGDFPQFFLLGSHLTAPHALASYALYYSFQRQHVEIKHFGGLDPFSLVRSEGQCRNTAPTIHEFITNRYSSLVNLATFNSRRRMNQ